MPRSWWLQRSQFVSLTCILHCTACVTQASSSPESLWRHDHHDDDLKEQWEEKSQEKESGKQDYRDFFFRVWKSSSSLPFHRNLPQVALRVKGKKRGVRRGHRQLRESMKSLTIILCPNSRRGNRTRRTQETWVIISLSETDFPSLFVRTENRKYWSLEFRRSWLLKRQGVKFDGKKKIEESKVVNSRMKEEPQSSSRENRGKTSRVEEQQLNYDANRNAWIESLGLSSEEESDESDTENKRENGSDEFLLFPSSLAMFFTSFSDSFPDETWESCTEKTNMKTLILKELWRHSSAKRKDYVFMAKSGRRFSSGLTAWGPSLLEMFITNEWTVSSSLTVRELL